MSKQSFRITDPSLAGETRTKRCNRCKRQFFPDGPSPKCPECRDLPAPILKQPPFLTKRQLDLAARMILGASNKQIAFDLGLDEGTIKVYVSAMFKRIGVSNRAEFVSVVKCRLFCPRQQCVAEHATAEDPGNEPTI